MSIYQRLWKLVSDLEKGNRAAFADKIGIKRVTFLGYLTEEGESRLRVHQLAAIAREYPVVNIHRLVTGQGEMYDRQEHETKGKGLQVSPDDEAEKPIETPVTDTIREAEIGLRKAGGTDHLIWSMVRHMANEKIHGGGDLKEDQAPPLFHKGPQTNQDE